MVEQELDGAYWSSRYQNEDTGWDIGHASTPLKTYIDELKDKSIRILVPGAGNAYEVEYLWTQGFTNTFLLDIAQEPIDKFRKRVSSFPTENCICEDFFQHAGQYDLILEQTFFCALRPSLRSEYARKMHELLAPGGRLVGLLFNAPMNADRPPFGGTIEEYRAYFAPLFHLHVFTSCYNSIAPRAGKEMFMILEKE